MMIVKVEADMSAFERKLSDIEQEQLPYATALALTRTAQYAKDALVAEMDKAFDKPTPYTKNALYVRPAQKRALIATVKVKDEAFKGNPAVKYLLPEIEGGNRNMKRFESLMIATGVMPAGYFAIPASGAPLDQYGNVPGSEITRILSQLGSSRDHTANQTVAGRKKAGRQGSVPLYFAVQVGGRGGLAPGIWKRYTTSWHARATPIFLFTRRQPAYSKRYRFYEVGQKAAHDFFPDAMKAAMKQAVASAH